MNSHTANERTFLGYLRTGQAFSMTGIFIAQLMRLQNSPTPSRGVSSFDVGIPLSSICQLMAIIITLVGAIRFLKLQKRMALGWAISGGWEIILIWGLSFAVRQTEFCTHAKR